MLDPASKFNMASSKVMRNHLLEAKRLGNQVLKSQGLNDKTPSDQTRSDSTLLAPYDHKKNSSSETREAADKKRFANLAKHRAMSKNFLLKRLDVLYWKRLFRYVYVRFLRMRSSPRAIARGVAAGAFAGSFPLLGLQTVFGVAIASCVRGNKVVAAASTWISNPLTYVPLFALNFQVGRYLLRLPPTEIPTSAVGLDVWMAMGMDVGAALMLGSLIVGLVMSVVGYYIGLQVAERVKKRKHTEKAK